MVMLRCAHRGGMHVAAQVLERIPHVLPHLFRVRLFRDEVTREKSGAHPVFVPLVPYRSHQ